MAASLFWYDLETFGTDPRYDRVAQFAGIRTGDDFNVIGDPVELYVRVATDYIPNPHSCLVTGIVPQDTREKGIPEYEFAERVFTEWMKPGTCVAGYNSIRFDDEFMRNVFYRNLYDPYLREYSNGNSRWDLIDVLRAARDLRPEGIEWPNQEAEGTREGRPSFRLEELSRANGIPHDDAHDALADVRVTIEMAKLLHEKQPKLFRFLFTHRSKEKVSSLINLHTREPLLHTSVMYTRPEGCTSLVSPLTVDPNNRNAVIAYDLRFDPRPLIELSVEKIREQVFTPEKELEGERIHLNTIALNKCPVIAPLKSLDAATAKRLKLDRDTIHQRWLQLRAADNLTEKVRAVFDTPVPAGEGVDVDGAIYAGGFFPDEDRTLFDSFHARGVEAWREFAGSFADQRAEKLLRRLIGRNYPQYLNQQEQKKWKNFCATRLLFPPTPELDDFGTFEKKLEVLSRSSELAPKDKLIVRRLMDYRNHLRETILSYT